MPLQRREERLWVCSDLLDCHNVEPAKRLGDAKDVAEVAEGRITGHRAPLGRRTVEGADVPVPTGGSGSASRGHLIQLGHVADTYAATRADDMGGWLSSR